MKRTASIYFILAALCALALMGAYAFLFYMISSAQKETRQSELEVARIEQEDAAILNAQETITALALDEETLRSYFVSEEDIVTFLEKLEREGESLQSSVEVVSVFPGEEDGSRLTLSLSIQGTFAAVMKTIGSMEHAPHDMRIESLTIDSLLAEEGSVWTAAATFSIGTTKTSP